MTKYERRTAEMETLRESAFAAGKVEGKAEQLEALKKKGAYCHPQGRGFGWLIFIPEVAT